MNTETTLHQWLWVCHVYTSEWPSNWDSS